MILEVKNIAKSFGKNTILNDVSFGMEPSTLIGIVGENGSGKSTLLKIIVGEWKSNSGNISINGAVGYCPQKPLLFDQLTVREHFQYFSAAYNINRTLFQERSEALMNLFNYKKYEQVKVANLSGGTQQKLNLSIALLHKPQLLILDEPYSGFDWDTYLKFWDYTKHLISEGCAILVVTHLLAEKARFNRIYDLRNGILV